MNKADFPNPKLKLPKGLRDSKAVSVVESFKSLDSYFDLVCEYVYTDINLNYSQTDPLRAHAWVQRIISEGLLRSLYIRNGLVDAINSRNTAVMYLNLKALLEIVGLFASILNILETTSSKEDLVNRLEGYALGNKGNGEFRIGEVEAINVITMLNNGNKYINKISKQKLKTFFTDYYDVASNPTHPSFDAHTMFGFLESSLWKAKNAKQIRDLIIEELPRYGGLLMSPRFIQMICEDIYIVEEVYFSKLDSKKLFS